MTMAFCKLCFITLALVIFYVNAVIAVAIFDKNPVIKWTKEQLQEVGYKMEWDKTEAFKYAFNHLRIAYAYQNELWKKFIAVYNRNKGLPDVERCKECMNCTPIPEFTNMQKNYMIYVKPLIEKYVKYTSARSPSDFCNDIESPPEEIISVNKYGNFEYTKNPKYNTPPPSVYQETQFQVDPNYQFASSSGANKPIRDFDLNQIPPDETE